MIERRTMTALYSHTVYAFKEIDIERVIESEGEKEERGRMPGRSKNTNHHN